MKEFFKKEPILRGIRTFFQAAAGVITANLLLIDITDSKAIKTLVAAAVAAGIAAAMNIEKE